MSDPATAAAAQELAGLNRRVESMRAVLVRLLQDVVEAERRLDGSQVAQLLEANEQLVVTALSAQTEAETAAGALDEAARVGGLDALTGLPNRALLLDRLAQAIAHAKRHGHRVALLFLDLNNFKQINDTFGHAVGDQAIQLVADCLGGQVRESDTVSRHGGDEFLILLAQVSQPSDAALIAEKVNAALGAYSRIDSHVIRLSASIGISVYPEDGEDAKTLIDGADAAMYLAKRHELGGYVFHADRPAVADVPSSKQRHDDLAMAEHERRYAQLREANEQLMVAALGAQELQAAAQVAQRQQIELLSVVAQELANPFAPIRIAAAMLGRQRADEALLPRAQAIVQQQMEQLSRLVSSLVEPAQAGKGKLTLDRRMVDVGAILGQVVQAARPDLNRRLQTLELRLGDPPLEVDADPALLALAFTNLISNAADYSHDGGRISISAGISRRMLMLTVADSGIGIESAAIATIFEPFIRDPHAGAANEAGLGIGLTVVRAIVEAHGGSVSATSPGVGLGSQFVVSLPLTRPA